MKTCRYTSNAASALIYKFCLDNSKVGNCCPCCIDDDGDDDDDVVDDYHDDDNNNDDGDMLYFQTLFDA